MSNATDGQYKELFFAAKAFIDCHAADPDLTNEMCDRYREYCDLLQRYNPTHQVGAIGGMKRND